MRWAATLLVASQVLAQDSSWKRPLASAGVRDARIVKVMDEVQRSDFLPKDQLAFAMEDRPLPIGQGQTTSQPSLIGLMIQEMRLRPGCTVLEVGTGSGYQTALLAKLCAHVYSIDIVKPLADEAKKRLARLGYVNAQVKAGDGYLGWAERGPFDAIVVCASVERVPQPLLEQLKKGGRLVVPVGSPLDSKLQVFEKGESGKLSRVNVLPVRFVPLTGDKADRDREER